MRLKGYKQWVSCSGTQGNLCRQVPEGFCVQESTHMVKARCSLATPRTSLLLLQKVTLKKTSSRIHGIRAPALPPSTLWCSCFTVFSLKAELWSIMALWEGLEQTDYYQPIYVPQPLPGGESLQRAPFWEVCWISISNRQTAQTTEMVGVFLTHREVLMSGN